MSARRLLLVIAALLFALAGSFARAQGEPTVQQIYETANRGDLPAAQQMVEQVLQAHPRSAKAHYVKAELAAKAGDFATARQSLRTAERLSPGLPFVKPASVAALSLQVDRPNAVPPPAAAPTQEPRADTRRMGGPPEEPAPAAREFPLGRLLVLALLALGAWALLRRRQPAPRYGAPDYDLPRYGTPGRDAPGRGDLFGRPGSGVPPVVGPGAAPQRSGMGSTLARGLGAGLVFGAGAAAAQELGHRMFERGHEGRGLGDAGPGADPRNADSPLARDAGLGAFDPTVNPDLGGTNFGVDDPGGGWDDAGGFDVGGDWDR